FFSSRRRHTRFSRDWSSDVCSSDLIAISSNGLGNAISQISGRSEEALTYFQRALDVETQLGDSLGMAMDLLSISDYYIEKKDFRSEERRVGKECRRRWSRSQ